jgi:molybdopterin molybdotransferase
VSRGEEDHVRAAVEALGSLYLWRLAIKPGRPVAFGQVGDAAFIGLPGNPVAAMVTVMRLARPLLLGLAGARVRPPVFYPVAAGFDYRGKKPGRREWIRARLESDGAGRPVAARFPADGSGILSSMVESDGLVELGDDAGPVAKGDRVDFLPFDELGA